MGCVVATQIKGETLESLPMPKLQQLDVELLDQAYLVTDTLELVTFGMDTHGFDTSGYGVLICFGASGRVPKR